MIDVLFPSVNPEEQVVNGDYKASTDNLRSMVSEVMANELVKVLNENGLDDELSYHIDDQHEEMLIRSLTKHIFDLSVKKGQDIHRTQKDGQLMGSITSFIFLCLANAAMCRWALEMSYDKEFRIVDDYRLRVPLAPLRVNGDDCTLKGPRDPLHAGVRNLKTNWLDITAFGGLESSIGKTLYSLPHRPVVVINSRTYDRVDDKWVERKFVNMGLLLGKARSVISGTGISEMVPYERLGSNHHELMKMCPDFLSERINKEFIYHNANTLRRCPNIPWAAPEYLGGPGLKPLVDMSMYDRKLASILIMNKSKDGDIIKKLTVERCPQDAEWNCHRLVQKRLDTLEVPEAKFKSFKQVVHNALPSENEEDEKIFDLEDNFGRLYKLMVCETLANHYFTDIFEGDLDENDNRLNDFKEDPKTPINKKLQQVLNKNNRAWSYVQHIEETGEFCDVNIRSQQDLLHEKKKFYVPVIDMKQSSAFAEVRKLNCS
jgi:hypothetical protein